MNILRLIVSVLIFSLLAGSNTALAKKERAKKAQDPTAAYENALERTKKQYRQGEISSRTVWQRLSALYKDLRKGDITSNPSQLLQSQAYLVKEAGYPLLSAKYASWALSSAKDPYAAELKPAWELLDKISEERQIHDILIELAQRLVESKNLPPIFGRNWNYFVGEARIRSKQYDDAIKYLSKLQIADRYYLPGRYQLAMTHLFQKEDMNTAGLILRSMTSNDIRPALDMKENVRREYVDYAHLALGRIQYERQKFPSSVKYFRKVRRNSSIYYNALFDQSWAFFLAGYPNHALGSLHAIDSPFFPGRFNPESSILRSIIYYWMCRYEDSKSALADFIENYEKPVSNLEQWLSKKNLSPENAFQLFEDLMSGVSSESLGISRDLLLSASKSDPMVFARERLATVVAEQKRLKSKGIFKTKKHTDVPQKMLDTWVDDLSKELGSVYIAELEALRDDFRNFRSQANFIYIELLMSEKEQAMGRELHSEAKLDSVSLDKTAKGWGKGNVPWKASDKGEYWWDEVGFYVYQEQPLCTTTASAE